MTQPPEKSGNPDRPAERYEPPRYGNLSDLSSSRTIVEAMGEGLLKEVAADYLELLETSTAVYEKNGDYALGIFSSGWCRFLDQASRNLCRTDDTRQALACGNWHCHESCWAISQAAMDSGEAVDRPCLGGIRIYAVPIRVGGNSEGEVVGSMNFGYGDPPKDMNRLKELAELYQVKLPDLVRQACAYESRMPAVIEQAKSRLKTAARVIGETIERKQTEGRLLRYQHIVAGTSDFLAFIDREYRYQEINDSYLRAFGKTREEIVGHTGADLFGADAFDTVLKPMQARCLAGEEVTYESWLDFPVLGHRCLDVRYTPYREADGQVSGIVVAVRDITARKRGEEALQRWEHIFRNASWAVVIANPNTHVMEAVNPAYAKMHGYGVEELVGQHLEVTFAPEERGQLVHHADIVHRDGHHEYEALHLRKDGTRFPVLTHVTAFRNEDGMLLYRAGTFQDISARKQAEDALADAKSFVESIVTNVPEVLYSTSGKDLNVTFLSQKCEALTGYTVEDFKNDNALWSRIIHPEDAHIGERVLERVYKGLPYEAEYRFIHKDGSTRWVRNSGMPILDSEGKLSRVDGSATDITERKQAEWALQESELRYRMLVENSPYCIHEVDLEGRLLSMNRAGLLMMGFESESQIRGMSYMDAVSEEYQPYVHRLLALAVEGEPSDFEFRAANGRRFQSSFVPIMEQHGLVSKIMGITQDVTERKQAEEDLRASESFLQMSQRIGRVGSWDWDLSTGNANWSDEMYRIHGLAKGEYDGTPESYIRFVHPDDRAGITELITHLRGGSPPYPIEYRIVRPDGKVRYVQGNTVLLGGDSGRGPRLVGTVTDITQRKEAELALTETQSQLFRRQRDEKEQIERELDRTRETLVRQTRLAALGQLSGSIAHELRNPLGVIRNAVYLIKRRLPSHDQKTTDYLALMEEEVEAANRIIHDLLSLSLGKEPKKEMTDLGVLVEDARNGLDLPNGIRFGLSLEPHPFMLMVDPAQFRRVFTNLIQNAVQAMGESGELAITARRSKGWDTLTIRDSGPGVEPDVRDRLFEPLCTTKVKGTGLGLTICRQIIERHSGTIELMHSADGGALFRIQLPRDEQ